MQDREPAKENKSDGERRPESEGPEPAPTDYRGNLPLLLIMLCVVLLAWVISLVMGASR